MKRGAEAASGQSSFDRKSDRPEAVSEKNAGLGEGVDAAVAGVFNLLGGSISKGQK